MDNSFTPVRSTNAQRLFPSEVFSILDKKTRQPKWHRASPSSIRTSLSSTDMLTMESTGGSSVRRRIRHPAEELDNATFLLLPGLRILSTTPSKLFSFFIFCSVFNRCLHSQTMLLEEKANLTTFRRRLSSKPRRRVHKHFGCFLCTPPGGNGNYDVTHPRQEVAEK